jgi:2-dehydropantoate 2-reductase
MATRYVVYGAGAIGSVIGGHLFRTGHETVLVGRAAHVEKIQSEGLRLVTPAETYTLKVPAVATAAEVGFRDGDVALLCVKSQDTERSLVEIRAAGGDTNGLPIVCCQNSITNEPAALRFFRRVYGGLVVVTGIFLEPGTVHNPVRGNAGVIEVGRYREGVDDVAKEVEAALTAASFGAWANPRIMDAKGAKLLGNLGNAMGAITDGKGDSRAFLGEVRKEAEACLTAAGLPFESRESFDARMKQNRGTNELPDGVRNLGSTWQSLMRGTGNVESDYLNGEIVRLGREHDIATPHNALLQEMASAMAIRGERPGRYTAQDLEQLVKERSAR